MLRHSNKKKGFTLLEIIVVLIIVGVLAAIALPNLFGQVERNRAQEALTFFSSIKSAVEACVLSTGADPDAIVALPAECDTIAEVGVTVPGNAAFAYTMATVAAPGLYSITATRGGATIVFARLADESTTCTGTGAYAGIC